MITTLITFGGIVFWLLAAIFALLITYSVNKESGVASPLFLTAMAVALTVAFTDVPLPEFTLQNVGLTFLAWFGIGTVWAFGKWVHLVIKIRNFARDFKEEDGDLRVRAQVEFEPNDAAYHLALPPKAGQFHTRIRTWITFWPASMLATILGDLISPTAEFIWNLGGRIATAVAGTFSIVSKRIYEG